MNDGIRELVEAIRDIRDVGMTYATSCNCSVVWKPECSSKYIAITHACSDADRARALREALAKWQATYGPKPEAETVPRREFERTLRDLQEAAFACGYGCGDNSYLDAVKRAVAERDSLRHELEVRANADTVPRADYEAVCKELDEARKDIKWLRAVTPASQRVMPVGAGTLPVNWDGMQTLLTRALKAEEEVEDLLAERDNLKAELDTSRKAYEAMHKEREDARVERNKAIAERDALRAELDAGEVVTCVYCGHEYPGGTPTSRAALLTEHIRHCENHPLHKAEAEIALLRASMSTHAREAHTALCELISLTETGNQENPWLGVTASVALLKEENKNLKIELDAARNQHKVPEWLVGISKAQLDQHSTDSDKTQMAGFIVAVDALDARLRRLEGGMA